MDLLPSLVTWANLPFTTAMGIVLTYAGLQASGLLSLLAGSSDSDHDADHDLDHDVDHDLDHDIDHDVGPDLDHDVETDMDHDIDHDVDHDIDHDLDNDLDQDIDQGGSQAAGSVAPSGGGSSLTASHPGPLQAGSSAGGGVLEALGVGKVPTSILWQSFLMLFGLIGVSVNTTILGMTGGLPTEALILSLPAGFLGGLGGMAGIARGLVRFLKPVQEAPGQRHLVGCLGVVVSGQVDDSYGEVRVKGPHGEQVQVYCLTAPRQAPLPHHAEVVIVGYDRERDRLLVTSLHTPGGTLEGQGASRGAASQAQQEGER